MTQWAKAIRARLEAWNWTQETMAEYVGFSQQRISDWAAGRTEPSDAAKKVLVEKLRISAAEVSPDWLRAADPEITVPATPDTEAAA